MPSPQPTQQIDYHKVLMNFITDIIACDELHDIESRIRRIEQLELVDLPKWQNPEQLCEAMNKAGYHGVYMDANYKALKTEDFYV